MLDALGVRGMSAEELKVCAVKLKGVEHCIAREEEKLRERGVLTSLGLRPRRTNYKFGDTLVLVWEFSQAESKCSLVCVLAEIVGRSFCVALRNGPFLRGCISIGPYVEADERFLGDLADEAAEWYERADWIGVVLCPTADMLVTAMAKGPEKALSQLAAGFYPEYDVRLKAEVKHPVRVLNWPFFWRLKALEEVKLRERDLDAATIREKAKEQALSSVLVSLADWKAARGDYAKVHAALRFYEWAQTNTPMEELLERAVPECNDSPSNGG